MHCNDALFTSDEAVHIHVAIDTSAAVRRGQHLAEQWMRFYLPNRPICQRLVRSSRDEENARKVCSAPVYLHVAAVENDDGSLVLALLAQVLSSGSEDVFRPSGNGVAAIATTQASFYPLGDIVVEALERKHPMNLSQEVRGILAAMIPVPFTSDIDRRAIEDLLRSV